MSERLYCCVDGGASTTRVALFDAAGRRLGLTVTGPTSLTLRGTDAWADILAAQQGLFAAAGLAADDLADTHFGIGLAGANNARRREQFINAAPPLGGLRVATDAYVATLAAHSGAAGAVVIVGTGSVGYRIEADGGSRLVGGWGFPIGDEGSGAWLGRAALAQATQVVDARYKGPVSEMHRALIERCGRTRDDMLDWLLGATSTQFAAVAPLVVECAAGNDPAALQLVTAAGNEIDALAVALNPGRHVPLSLVGGLAEPLTPYLPAALRAWMQAPHDEPIAGALMLARSEAPEESLVWREGSQWHG